MKKTFILLLIKFQIFLVSTQSCLTRSGDSSDFWHLCLEQVTYTVAALKCESFFLNLTRPSDFPVERNTTWYSWFNEKSNKNDQIDETSKVFNNTLKSLIEEQNNQLQDLKCNINIILDQFIKYAENISNSSEITEQNINDLKTEVNTFNQSNFDILDRSLLDLKNSILNNLISIQTYLLPNTFNKNEIEKRLNIIEDQIIVFLRKLSEFDTIIGNFKQTIESILTSNLVKPSTSKLEIDLKNRENFVKSNFEYMKSNIGTRLKRLNEHLDSYISYIRYVIYDHTFEPNKTQVLGSNVWSM